MEIIVKDLEAAQKARFEKSKDKYNFFADPEEREVFQEILDLREVIARDAEDNAVPRRGRAYQGGRRRLNRYAFNED